MLHCFQNYSSKTIHQILFSIKWQNWFSQIDLRILLVSPFMGLLPAEHPGSSSRRSVLRSWREICASSQRPSVQTQLCHFACDLRWVVTAFCASLLSPEIWGGYIFISNILSCSIDSKVPFQSYVEVATLHTPKLSLTLWFRLRLSWSLFITWYLEFLDISVQGSLGCGDRDGQEQTTAT